MWLRLLDRMSTALSAAGADSRELTAIRHQVDDYLHKGAGVPEQIEARLQSFAGQHPELVSAAVEQIMGEIFELLDPEIARLRKARENGELAARDTSVGQNYIALLEECNRILEMVKG
jgi:hypothetical protein